MSSETSALQAPETGPTGPKRGMDLGQSMLLLARALYRADESAADLTRRVRRGLLALLAGNPEPVAGTPAPGIPDPELAKLAAWLISTYGAPPRGASALYQDSLAYTLASRPDGGLEAIRERRTHRATGAYYTSEAVVWYMMRRARYFLPTAAAIVDPACGAGAFLAVAQQEFGENVRRLVGPDADQLALALCQKVVPEAELFQVDALLADLPGGYDLCVGNPPYISSGLRGAAFTDPSRTAALRARFPSTAEYKLNTYPLFVERGLELLRPGGVLAFVLPDSFLSGRYFSHVRRLLLDHTLLELTLVQQDFWTHGRVGQSVILLVRKGSPPDGHKVDVKICPTVVDLERIPSVQLPLDELVWGPLHRFRLIPDEPTRRLVMAVERVPGSRPLGEFLQSYSGLIARQGQKSLLRSVNPNLQGSWGRLLRSGREIDRYRLAWSGEEVCLDRRLIKSGGNLTRYRQPKLLLRQTADSLRAVYDDAGYFCLNNIHLLTPRHNGVDLWALLGFLNSALVDRYYRAMTMESGRLYAQVDLDLLESIPVPSGAADLWASLADAARARQSAAPNEAAPFEERINRLVEALYAVG